MKTLAQLRNIVTTNLGKNDSDTVTLVDEALNTAAICVAAAFDPPELSSNKALNIAGSQDITSAVIPNFMEFVKIRNNTSNMAMGFIPWELWDHIIPSVNQTKYYSWYGQTLYVARNATGPITNIQLYYRQYPARMVSDSNTLGFENFDGLVTAVATAIVWAAYEEVEASKLQADVFTQLGAAASISETRKKIIQGALTDFEEAFLKGGRK